MDTFDDLPRIPYGDPVFYRIVALREIRNERSQIEMVPSKPSNLVMASLVDNQNPPPPRLSYSSDAPTGSPLTLPNVTLKPGSPPATTAPTTSTSEPCRRALDEDRGAARKSASSSTRTLAASDLQNGSLAKEDEDGNRDLPPVPGGRDEQRRPAEPAGVGAQHLSEAARRSLPRAPPPHGLGTNRPCS